MRGRPWTQDELESCRAGLRAYEAHYDAVDAAQVDEYPLPEPPGWADSSFWRLGWSDLSVI